MTRVEALARLAVAPTALAILLALPVAVPQSHGPEAAIAAVRAAAIVLAAWSTVTILLGGVARATCSYSISGAVDKVLSPARRRALDFAFGAALTIGVLAPASPAMAQVVDDTPVMRQVIDEESPPPAITTTQPPHADGPGVAAGEWTIAHGDHLWRVAERTLASSWQRNPTDEEVVPYWRRLIEANRHRLLHRDNPDLVFGGQVMSLPEVPPPPR